MREYYKCNSDSIKKRNLKYQKEQYGKNINYRLRSIVRSRLNHVFRGKIKPDSVIRSLGCTIKQLKTYLEAQFQPGMTWDNYGRHGWHIDHIMPLSSFDLTDPGQFREACHYTNLQPLWAKDNLQKACKPGETVKQLSFATIC